MKKFRITELLISIVSAELAGAVSALLSGGEFRGYFETLNKPPLSPPAWVFPVVWAALYALMGYSAYLIYLSDNRGRSRALAVYISQLAANFLWSPVFFGKMSFIGGIVIIAALDILVAVMMIRFYGIRRKATLMNIPYLVWCLYATYLTVGTYILNR